MQRREILKFNPENSDHRSDLFHVMRAKTFTGCKHIYALEGSHGDVLSMMKERTLDWYTKQEFKEE